jgi:TetR/AcrR family transcriptional repressor of nem operon
MARAQFDRNDVLDKAIDLFWQHGYSASSMQQVTQTTGLKPGSIYLAFGNKEGLFREALERYSQKSMARIRHTLDSAPSIGLGICDLLEKNVQESTREDYCSCFLVKTRLELASEGNELHKLASAKLDEVEALLESYLEKEYGEVVSRPRAISLMLHIFGMRVYGYRCDSARRIRQGLQAGLPWLPWEETRTEENA